jgi:hypothetical protein
MKLFKRLMAGAMAIAMLSAYTVALATTYDPTTDSGGGKTATVSGAGRYAGNIAPVFVMKLPTAAGVSNSLAFTIDPQKILENSKPANADSSSDFGTVIFQTVSGATTIYTNKSEPLKVVSKSSVDVTVNMLATLSDSKMKLFESDTFSIGSGFSATNKTDYLYLGVKVDTTSGGVSAISGAGSSGVRIISGATAVTDTKTVSPLGAKKATVLKAISENFVTVSGGTVIVEKSGANAGSDDPRLDDDCSWNSVEYTVMGASNPNADWQIDGLEAPNLTIKWMIDPANKITATLPAPVDKSVSGNTPVTWTGQLDKDAYADGETVTIFIKPTDSTKKVKSVTFTYVSVDAKDPTVTGKSVTVKTNMVGTTVGDVTTPTVVNGVYSATFTMPAPSNMAKQGMTTGTGTGAVAYSAPYFTATLG